MTVNVSILLPALTSNAVVAVVANVAVLALPVVILLVVANDADVDVAAVPAISPATAEPVIKEALSGYVEFVNENPDFVFSFKTVSALKLDSS